MERCQKLLAQTAEISLAGLRNIEGKRSVPRVDTLTALADALEVGIQDLIIPVPELRAVRFRSFKSLKTREQILADVSRWLMDFNELEEMLGDKREFSSRLEDGKNVSSDPIEAAGQIRERPRVVRGVPRQDFLDALRGRLGALGLPELETRGGVVKSTEEDPVPEPGEIFKVRAARARVP